MSKRPIYRWGARREFWCVLFAVLLFAASSPWAYAAPRAAICSWAEPGADSYTGTFADAVDSYQDMSVQTRATLKAKLDARRYDDVVLIKRDAIVSDQDAGRSYGAEITGMHFGAGRTCAQVDRSAWSAQHQERGYVYCADGHCIVVPTVCRNISRIAMQQGGIDLGGADVQIGGGGPSYADIAGGRGFANTTPLDAPMVRYVEHKTDSFVVRNTTHLHFDFAGPPRSWLPPPVGGGHVTPVPEPSTWAMFGLGLCCVAWVSRRRAAAARAVEGA